MSWIYDLNTEEAKAVAHAITTIKERELKRTNSRGNKIKARDLYRHKIANTIRNNIRLTDFLNNIYKNKRENLLLLTKDSIEHLLSAPQSPSDNSNNSDENSDLNQTIYSSEDSTNNKLENQEIQQDEHTTIKPTNTSHQS